VKNDEAYGIALPPKPLEEFQAYIERNGMLEHARRLIYEEEPVGNDEHRLDKLNYGMTWGCKCTELCTELRNHRISTKESQRCMEEAPEWAWKSNYASCHNTVFYTRIERGVVVQGIHELHRPSRLINIDPMD